MRKSVWVLIILVAAAAIYTGVWYATATFVREQTTQWLDGRRQQGFTITAAAPKLSGFPLKAEAVFDTFSITSPNTKGAAGWTLQTPGLRVFARPFVFDRFFLDIAGAYNITGLAELNTPLNLEQGLVTLILGPRGVDRVTVALTNAAATFGALGKTDFEIAAQEKALHIALTASDLKISEVVPPQLSSTVENLELSLDITGALRSGAPLPAILEAWRADGGTVEVRALTLSWPPVSASGSGTLALDNALQPEGAFTANFRGFMDVVDMLANSGQMTPQEASLARGALVLLSTTPHEGAPPELKLAVTVQDGKLTAGPVTLMKLPPITWRKDIFIP